MTTREEQIQTDYEDRQRQHFNSSCPQNYGDCPDCEHNEAGDCNYEEIPTITADTWRK